MIVAAVSSLGTVLVWAKYKFGKLRKRLIP